MFMQAFAIIAYAIFGALIVSIWPTYKTSFRNIGVFVFFGGLGFMLAGLIGNLLSDEEGIIENSIIVYTFLGMLAVGLFGGSYIGLKLFGVKADGA